MLQGSLATVQIDIWGINAAGSLATGISGGDQCSC